MITDHTAELNLTKGNLSWIGVDVSVGPLFQNPNISMNINQILQYLEENADPSSKEGLNRFGIKGDFAMGIRMPVLRKLAKDISRNHELALSLWAIPKRETRILAGLLSEKSKFTKDIAEDWASDFYDWEIVDQTCFNILDQTKSAAPFKG